MKKAINTLLSVSAFSFTDRIKNRLLVVIRTASCFALSLVLVLCNCITVYASSSASGYVEVKHKLTDKFQSGVTKLNASSLKVTVPRGSIQTETDTTGTIKGELDLSKLKLEATLDTNGNFNSYDKNGGTVNPSLTGQGYSYNIDFPNYQTIINNLNTTGTIKPALTFDSITVDVESEETSITTGSYTYTLSGSYTFVRSFYIPAPTDNFIHSDYCSIVLRNATSKCTISGAKGTISQKDYVEVGDGLEHFHFGTYYRLETNGLPRGSVYLLTEVEFSVVIPGSSSTSDVTFTITSPAMENAECNVEAYDEYIDASEFYDLFTKQNELTQDIMTGYDSNQSNNVSSDFSGSMTSFEQAQGDIVDNVSSGLNNFEIGKDGVMGMLSGATFAIPLVSAMLQGMYESMGSFGLLVAIGITMTIVCMLLGFFKFYKGG